MRGDAGSENVLSCDHSSLPLPLASLLSLGLSRGDAKACHWDYFPFSIVALPNRLLSNVLKDGCLMCHIFEMN